MNYIEQILAFGLLIDEYQFTPTEVALWYALMRMCNSMRWTNPFNRQSDFVAAAVGVSKQTLDKAKIKLRECGVINYVSINGSSNIKWELIDLTKIYQGSNKGLYKGSDKGSDNGKPNLDKIDKGSDKGSHVTNAGGSHVLNININKTKYKENTYRQFAHLELSTSEFEKLISEGYLKADIDRVLDAIENYKANKKYESLYLTAKNWLNRKEKSSAKKENQFDASRIGSAQTEKAKRFDKAIAAFETYKLKNNYRDWDNEVYDFLLKNGMIEFIEGDERLNEILRLEKEGKISEAKQIGLMVYFNDLAEAGTEVRDLLNHSR